MDDENSICKTLNRNIYIENDCSLRFLKKNIFDLLPKDELKTIFITHFIVLCDFMVLISKIKLQYRLELTYLSKNWDDMLRLRLCQETEFVSKCFRNNEDYENFLEEYIFLDDKNKISEGSTKSIFSIRDICNQEENKNYHICKMYGNPSFFDKLKTLIKKSRSKSPSLRKRRKKKTIGK